MSTQPPPLIILGSSFSGLSLTYTLLQHLLHPLSKSAAPTPLPKIILISSSTHTYWNPASVRALVHQDTLPDEKLFLDIRGGLKGYEKEGLVEFIHARVEGVDFDAQRVRVRRLDDDDGDTAPAGETEELAYGQLVIATGASQQPGTPFRHGPGEGHHATKQRLKEWQGKIKAAGRILVSGGGATAVETVSEIKNRYGKEKEVILVTAGGSLIGSGRTDVDVTAKKILENGGVKVLLNTRVTGSDTTADGKIIIKLKPTSSEGEESTEEVDLYLPAHGLIPNTSFLPKTVLDENGWVKTTPTLQITSQTSAWAIGDVTTYPFKQTALSASQLPILAHNLAHTLKLRPSKSGEGLKSYTPDKTPTVVVPILGSGTGLAMGFKVPGFLVHQVKGKGLLLGFHEQLRSGGGMYVKKF